MALEKRVTKAVAVSGDHTLTLSDVTGLVVGYQVVIAGVMASGTYNGTHTITAIDTDGLTITYETGNHTHTVTATVGRVNVPVTWADDNDVLGFLGVEPASAEDEAYLEVSVKAGNEWCYRRRRSSAYDDLVNAVPDDACRLAVVLYASALYRERGSVDSYQSFQDMSTVAPIGSMGQILKLLGCNRPVAV
jgi:uncharacterized protein YerC